MLNARPLPVTTRLKNKINLWLKVPKRSTPANWTPADSMVIVLNNIYLVLVNKYVDWWDTN